MQTLDESFAVSRLPTVKHGALSGLTGVVIERDSSTVLLECATRDGRIYLRLDARNCAMIARPAFMQAVISAASAKTRPMAEVRSDAA